MDLLRGIFLRLRALVLGAAADRELDDELRLHLELETEAGVARGLGHEEARRAAVLRFGAMERYREETRELRGGRWVDELRTDVRIALRQLRRSPMFAAAAIASLALGIGANTAIFSVVDAVLLTDLPFTDPDRLVVVWQTDRASETMPEPASWPDLEDYRERSRTLAGAGVFMAVDGTLMVAGSEPERVSALGVTPDLLHLLGVRPLHGRLFDEAEVTSGEAQHVVVSEAWWRTRFPGDVDVIGSSVLINERPATIIGVVRSDVDVAIRQMHRRADYHVPLGGARVDVYVGISPDAATYARSTHPFLVVGRLAEGATAAAASAELAGIAADLEAMYPENADRGARVETVPSVVFGPLRPALLLLIGAVALVLLASCANMANLLLARTATRSREVAMRRALGAARSRVSRQFFVESAVLTALGAAAGLAVAHAGLRVLVSLAPADIPRIADASLDPRVLLFTACVAMAVTLAFGVLPALQLRRSDLNDVLKATDRSGTASRAGRRLRAGLVVAEVALAVALTIGAGLLLRSFQELRQVDPGFRAAGVLKAQYDLPEVRYPLDFSRWPDLPAIHRVHDELRRRTAAMPGVEAAALAAPHPLDAGFTNSFVIIGRESEAATTPEIRTRFITPGYLATLDVPLLSGRDLRESDVASAPRVALINAAAADRYFAGMEPLGRELRFWGIAWTIVGVIGDERFHGLSAGSEPAVYAPLAQAPQNAATLLVRTSGDPLSLAPSIRAHLRDIDPQLALHGVESLETTLAGSLSTPRFLAALISLFGAVALVLALVGVHGVLSYMVAQRSREMGIRVALGAGNTDVLRAILGEGARLALLGIGIGLVLALALSRLLPTLLFGVSTSDFATYIAVAAGMLATALLASWLPARRMLRLPPAAVLRAD